MDLIADQAGLAAYCSRLKDAPFVTVDTEFLREKTYWPLLCLVQLAGPDEAHAIDALAPGLDLTPLFDLMADESVLKVFHAARQDVEIFHHMSGKVPTPLFDTQVAAMVCGFGDAVSYETLATQLAKAKIDKSLRFTDWSARPLSEKQLQYALADVTHLRVAYEKLERRLTRDGRAEWLTEEMAILADPATYVTEPKDAWKRMKSRSSNPRFLQVLKGLAAWREQEAQSRDLPRQRVVKDDILLEVAARAPTTTDEMARTRGLPKGMAEGRFGQAMVDAVTAALAVPAADWPIPTERLDIPRSLSPVIDLLKVLLKLKCDQHGVAQKLVASSYEIDMLAADDNADIPANRGWRRAIFGEDAIRLKHGQIALGLAPEGKGLRLIPVE